MASILRSSKFVRYFAGLTRSIVFNSARDVDGTFIQKIQCISSGLRKSLTTQAVPSHNRDSSLDKILKRLDQEVRRTGRVTKRDLENVLEEVRYTGSATSTQSLLIIRCCGDLLPEASLEVRTQLIEEIWKTLEKIAVPMDVSHYNALLRVYLENEHQFSPTEFLANLEHKGVEPNRVTYQRLIARYCQQGDIEGATRILEFMREKQLPVNEKVFNALIMGHFQADDMGSASGILGVMQQAGLEPSADTYSTLLCGYAKKGDIDAINKTLEECEAKDIHLLDKDYMDVIYSLAINNHIEHVDKVIDRMKKLAGYNQDAVHLILRLVNHGLEDLGYKIFLTMPIPSRNDGEQGFVGAFFIRQLVQANRPIEKITSICEKLEISGLNPRALFIAVESSLQSGNVDQSCALLHVLREKGLPIRQHYFWPLFASHCNNVQRVVDILSRMCTEFGLVPVGETLKDYVIPSMENKSSNEIISLLRGAGTTAYSAANAVLINRLTMNSIAEAAQIAIQYPANYSPLTLRKPLVQAYIHTEDKDSFITVLRQIHDGVDRRVIAQDEDLVVAVPDRAEIVGNYVLDITTNIKDDRAPRIAAILQGLIEHGLSLSNSSAERVQEELGEELTSEISSLLGKLTSGELVPTMLRRPPIPPSGMDEGQLLKIRKMLEEKGESTLGIRRQLLRLYCVNKDLEKSEQIVKELEADDFVFNSGMYALLLELYAHYDKLDEALNIVNKLEEKDPEFVIDHLKVIKVASIFIKNDKVPEAVKFLSDQAGERKFQNRSIHYNAVCWQLLNSLAEQGKLDELKQVFDTLVKHEYIEVNNGLLGPLIKVHIVRDDLAGAMEQFEWCSQKYRFTPCKNELACKMIQVEDAAALQKLTDLSTQIHGEVNVLYDLVLSFVECGRIRQAHKILETRGLRSRPDRFHSACERYLKEGLVAPLEGLVEATRDIYHIDRSNIYYHLLLSYCKLNDPDKALGLWTSMQEEDVQPSEEFLLALGTFLKNEGREVPFVIPEATEVRKAKKSHGAQETKPPPTAILKFRQALLSGDLDGALEYKQTIESVPDQRLHLRDLSSLIEGLTKAGRLGEALKITVGMLETGLCPSRHTFRFLLNEFAAAGDIDTLTDIGKLLTPEMKKTGTFDNKLCHAYKVAGKSGEFLKILAKEIDNAKESDIACLEEKFPKGAMIGVLDQHPELHSEYEQLALKFAAKGVSIPINVLWLHLFVKGQDEAAKKLWDNHLSESPRFMYQYILSEASDNQDENLPRKLISHLQDTAASERPRIHAYARAYSCLVDVLVNAEKYDKALETVREALKDTSLENMNRVTLHRLRAKLINQGKSFPFEIPPKDAKHSSSSSSDDEP